MTPCAEQRELRAYCLGALPREAAVALEDHLAECPSCESALDAGERVEDDLVAGVREAGGEEPPLAGPPTEIAALIALVRTNVSALSTRPHQPTRSYDVEVGPRATSAFSDRRLPISARDFQTLLLESRLYTQESLRIALSKFSGTPHEEAIALARWMVERNLLTRFQARELCHGRARGLKLGDYELREEIGQGGMGSVYRSRNVRMERDAAVKVLAQRTFDSPESRERFRREARVIAKLSHPNVVAAYDAGEVVDVLYLAMEYVDGVDLGELVRQSGPLPVSQAVDYIRQAAHGLCCAHDRGIVHRDVKPSNLLVARDGTVRVSDLGLARFSSASETDSLTETGQILGTFDYMSPEQAFQVDCIGERSDVYSLGWTLFYLLTGEVPFPEASRLGKLVAHRDAPIPSLCERRKDVPAELDHLFQRMVAKRLENRPASMQAVLDGLAQLALDSRQAHPPSIPGRSEPDLEAFFHDLELETREARQTQREQDVRTSQKRHARRLAIAAALVIAAALAIGAYSLGQREKPAVADRAGREIGGTNNSEPPRQQAPPDIPIENPERPPAANLFGEIGRIQLPDRVNRLAYAPGRGVVYAAAGDNVIHIVDIASQTVVGQLSGLKNPVIDMALSPDETRLVTSVGDRTLRFWNLETGKQVLRTDFPLPLFRIAYDPRGKTLLGAVNVTAPLAPNVRTTRLRYSLLQIGVEGGPGPKQLSGEQSSFYRSVTYSPQGNLAAAGGDDGTVTLVSVESGEVVKRWSDHRGQTQALAFSGDGLRLFSADVGGLIRCRNVEDGKVLYQRVVPHGITGLDVNADESRLLLQGTIDVRVLDLPAMNEQSLTVMHGHESPISGLLFLDDEGQAVSSSWDHTIRIWKLPPRR